MTVEVNEAIAIGLVLLFMTLSLCVVKLLSKLQALRPDTRCRGVVIYNFPILALPKPVSQTIPVA